MAANPTYNDGGLEYGSALLAVTPKAGGGNFNVIADAEFNYDSDSKRVEQTNQYGEPLAAFGVPVNPTGTCTVQLPATKRIVAGDTFTEDSGSGYTWIVTKATNPFEKDGYRKQSITYFKKINA